MENIKANKLINEKSPYLLAHAYNKVNWCTWDEEAFEMAQEENKPIFISIGYSTCHWCHVMNEESFEDEEIANYLNDHFISIKIDREERRDIDSVYMEACRALSGSAGWPLSIFVNHDKQPFFTGTYFYRDVFLELLKEIKGVWQHEPENVQESAEYISELLSKDNRIIKDIDYDLPNILFRELEISFDPNYGGFLDAPKFYLPSTLLFLMRYYQCNGEKKALDMVSKTLDSIREGGIYDQIGFGFSRYATDNEWLIPHFEKMLYDNVLLMIVYRECYKLTKENRFLRTAEEIASYLDSRMSNEAGGFFTAEDADSNGEEGEFYLFTKEEIEYLLKDDAEEFCKMFNVTEEGNFENANILNLIGSKINEENTEFIEKCRQKLFHYRNTRVAPSRDEKILTAYNGLAIVAYALLHKQTNKTKYLNTAKRTYRFIKENLYKDGKLYARYKDGESKYLGYSEDYAYLIWGLLELYQISFEKEYLEFAIELNNIMINSFYDHDQSGFYLTDKDAEVVLYRKKEIYDGVTPSSNSVQIYNLLRLASLTGEEYLNELATNSLEYFTNDMSFNPLGHSFAAINVLIKNHGITSVVIASESEEEVKEYVDFINSQDLLFVDIRIDTNQKRYPLINNKTTIYVCKDNICLPAIDSKEDLLRILQ